MLIRKRSRRYWIGFAAVIVVAAWAGAYPHGAAAAPNDADPTCGATITRTTVLHSDIGPCPGTGLIIGADGIVLNLGHHEVLGMAQSGQGAGIYLLQRSGVRVMNGSVSGFNAGVVIEGGAGNTVQGITAHDNLGGANSDYGDGILIESSSDNRIRGNEAIHNGPFSGIGIVSLIDSDHPRTTAGTSTGNEIANNVVRDNNVGRTSTLVDNDGIRIEPDTTGTIIRGNDVSGSGLDGISLFRGSGGSVISHNSVTGNGFKNQVGRHGDGIIAFNLADGNQIDHNIATGNAANGIQIRGPVRTTPGSTGNVIEHNAATGNSQLPAIPSPVFGATYDLKDANPNCDSNIWDHNEYGTAFPDCTTN